ncbi:MAG: hypothetical protein AAYR33_09185 [Acetobacteraceae bacterium]
MSPGGTTQLAEIRTSADTVYWLETRVAKGGKQPSSRRKMRLRPET